MSEVGLGRVGGTDGRDAGAGEAPSSPRDVPGVGLFDFPHLSAYVVSEGDEDSVSGSSCKSNNSQTCSSTCDANICKARWRRRPIVCLAALPRLSILQSRRMIQSGIEGRVDQDARVAHSVGISTALFLLSPPRAAAPDRPGNKPHKPRQLRRPSLRSLRLARFNWVAVGPTDRRWRGPCRGAEDVRLVNSTVQAL